MLRFSQKAAAVMRKSIFTREYRQFVKLLRAARLDAGLSQEQIAARLGTTQSIVSKCERGERRLDIVELWRWCAALDRPFSKFVRDLERNLSRGDG